MSLAIFGARCTGRSVARQGLLNRRTRLRQLSGEASKRRVAVLYQALDPPLINGVRKPKKPGGMQKLKAWLCFVC